MNTPATRRRSAAIVATLAAALLSACATPYQPMGPMGGFTDRLVSPGRYSVEFRGNGNTSADTVANLYLYRCAELTVRNGFDVFRSMSPEAATRAGWTSAMASGVSATRMAQAPHDAELTEFKGAGTTRYVPIYTPARPVTIHRVTGVVQMGRYADVPSNVRVWDARVVMKTLEPLVKGNGGAKAALKPEALAQVAMVNGRGRAASTAGTSLDDLQNLLQQAAEAQ